MASFKALLLVLNLSIDQFSGKKFNHSVYPRGHTFLHLFLSKLHLPDIIHIMNALGPFPYFTTLLLLHRIVNVNWRTRNGRSLGTKLSLVYIFHGLLLYYLWCTSFWSILPVQLLRKTVHLPFVLFPQRDMKLRWNLTKLWYCHQTSVCSKSSHWTMSSLWSFCQC